MLLSDDAHSDLMRALGARSWRRRTRPPAIDYLAPAARGTPERKGDAKAGNLNAALDRLDELAPDAAFIETRDADDLVGDRRFLRRCVGQLAADPDAAFVQTAKEAVVSRGDPFDNLQPHFFRGSMLARHAANAVFPCGSGARLAPHGARGHRRLPDLEPRRGPAVRRRGAAPRLARRVPPDRGARRPARPRGPAERLQAARHLGGRHDPAAALGGPPRALAAPAPALRRARPLLPAELRHARLPGLPGPRAWPRASTRCRRPTAATRCTSGPSRSPSSSSSPRSARGSPTRRCGGRGGCGSASRRSTRGPASSPSSAAATASPSTA